ncbi:hypothetical protein AVEN_107310-1 [Araneus ventricosus]|uniref:Uncharacterized protein n=1 Tax=Araneus ventricosus TaxID=182803 RepID=A0A4Y2DS40_ARAVE|nr:hypothetical protein AVEN_107310-1 [Araneus ventricosus]
MCSSTENLAAVQWQQFWSTGRALSHSYSTYQELIAPPPSGSITNDTRHPTPSDAITVRSQVYINLSPKNLSSPYDYRYPIARSGDEGNRLVHSSFRASQTEPNLFRRRRSKYSPKGHYKYFHRWLENPNTESELPSAS